MKVTDYEEAPTVRQALPEIILPNRKLSNDTKSTASPAAGGPLDRAVGDEKKNASADSVSERKSGQMLMKLADFEAYVSTKSAKPAHNTEPPRKLSNVKEANESNITPEKVIMKLSDYDAEVSKRHTIPEVIITPSRKQSNITEIDDDPTAEKASLKVSDFESELSARQTIPEVIITPSRRQSTVNDPELLITPSRKQSNVTETDDGPTSEKKVDALALSDFVGVFSSDSQDVIINSRKPSNSKTESKSESKTESKTESKRDSRRQYNANPAAGGPQDEKDNDEKDGENLDVSNAFTAKESEKLSMKLADYEAYVSMKATQQQLIIASPRKVSDVTKSLNSPITSPNTMAGNKTPFLPSDDIQSSLTDGQSMCDLELEDAAQAALSELENNERSKERRISDVTALSPALSPNSKLSSTNSLIPGEGRGEGNREGKPRNDSVVVLSLGPKDPTIWVPPSIPDAVEFKEKTLFRHGTSSLWEADITTAEDLSLGVLLYFEFARSSCICMFVLSILSIPSIILSYSGSRIALSDRDAMGFSQFTIGNMGYDPKSATYKADSTCKYELSTYNGTCISVFGGEMRFADAETVLTTFEFLQITSFFIFIIYLSWKARSLRKHLRQDECKVEDYTIMCRRLPKETTSVELTQHFDALYPLNKTDWHKRELVARTRVVQNCENSGDTNFIGTWIADCVIFTAIGKGLSAFKLHEDWTINLLRSRAMVYMYSDGTSHKGGPNISKKKKAEKDVTKVVKKIEKLTEHLNAHKAQLTSERIYVGDAESQQEKIKPGIDVVAGFVTFEYCESMRRCVEDYSYYNSFPRNLLFYPKRLIFKGKRIKVEKAPDPGEIIWEHLEISGISKKIRRLCTALISLILLIISFTAILQASIYKGVFASKIPPGSLCSKAIPTIFGAYENITNFNDFSLVRPNSTYQTLYLDSQCDSFIPGSFYVVYSEEDSLQNTVASYDFQACNSSAIIPSHFYRPSILTSAPTQPGGPCPNYGQKIFCPCISKRSTQTCSTSGCSIPGASKSCLTYSASALDSCYCQQILNTFLTQGIAQTLNYLRSLKSSTSPDSSPDSCTVFLSDYSTAQGISYGTIFISIFVNIIVLYIMKRLSTFEAHVSVDRENATLMMKIFLFTYANMAFTVLIAFGNIPNLPFWLRTIYIFQGQYTDFSSEWYTNTGVYLLTSYFIKALVDIMTKLVTYNILAPTYRYLVYPSIKSKSSHSVVTQFELNQMQVGPLFDSSINNAHFLSMLFFSMTYAAGLPILMPMAFVSSTLSYHVDRLLLLRFNQKPPQMGDEIIQIILKIIPFAAIIRLSFACWMFGNPGIFDTNTSTSPYLDLYEKWLSALELSYILWFANSSGNNNGNTDGSTYHDSTYFIVERVFRPNVFPLLVLLVIIIVSAIIQIFWKYLPCFWIEQAVDFMGNIIYQLKNWRCGVRRVHVAAIDMSFRQSDIRVLRIGNNPMKHSAPFTGEYFCHLPSKSRSVETAQKSASCVCCCDGGVPKAEVTRRKQITKMNDLKDGWLFIDSTEVEGKNYRSGEVGCAYKVKKWIHTSQNDGNLRNIGDPKMTYEVISDSGCSSYSLHKIPGYMMAINGLQEGNILLRELHRNHDDVHETGVAMM